MPTSRPVDATPFVDAPLPGNASFRVNLDELDRLTADLREVTERLGRSLVRLTGLGEPDTGHAELDAACSRLVEAWHGRISGLADVVRDYHDRVVSTRDAYAEADAAVEEALGPGWQTGSTSGPQATS